MKRWVRSGALAIAIAATLVACTSKREPGAADLTLNGRVQLISSDRHTTTAFRSQRVGPGNTVKVLKGRAILRFAGDRRLELRPGASVKVDSIPVLLHGDALAVSEKRRFVVKAAGS